MGQGLGTHTRDIPQHSCEDTSMHTKKGRTRSPGTLVQGSLYRGWLRPQVLPPVVEVVLADGCDGGRSKYTGGGASGPWPRSQLSHAMAV